MTCFWPSQVLANARDSFAVHSVAPLSSSVLRRPFRCHAASQARAFPAFVPPQVSEIKEQAALDMLARIQRTSVPLADYAVESTFVGPAEGSQYRAGVSPVLLLHGFDGSCTEFRRLKPLLDPHLQTWAVDLLGNGFCGSGLEGRPNADLGPQQRREHMFALWEQQIKQPVTVVGTSLGGAVALDFALAHPEAVKRLVLLSPQCFTDGIGPMASLPDFAARLGVRVLQTFWLRAMAGKMEYYDKERYATDDAVRIGRLHTLMPGWLDATVAFTRSGGYVVSNRIKDVTQDTIVVWGKEDKILDPKSGQQFVRELPHARLIYVGQCGHCPHLEQPEQTAAIILEALGIVDATSGAHAAVAA